MSEILIDIISFTEQLQTEKARKFTRNWYWYSSSKKAINYLCLFSTMASANDLNFVQERIMLWTWMNFGKYGKFYF